MGSVPDRAHGPQQTAPGELEGKFKQDTVIPIGCQEDISGILSAADVLAGKCGTGYAMRASFQDVLARLDLVDRRNGAETIAAAIVDALT